MNYGGKDLWTLGFESHLQHMRASENPGEASQSK